MKRLACAVLCLLALPPLCLAAGRPMDMEAEKVHELLLQGKYAELEAIEKRTRDLTVVMSDGQPLRAAFFSGLGCACSGGKNDLELREKVRKTRTLIRAWRMGYPDSVAAVIADAALHRDHAWAVRGMDWARNVPDEAWRLFRREVQEAARKLDAMPESARDEPGWYGTRLLVARDERMPPEKFVPLLEKAIERHPRYLPIYFAGASFLAPRWGGSLDDLKRFVERAVRATPWMGDTMYARIHWSEQNPEMFTSGQASWPRMKKSFERLIADYPDPWNLNNFGNFACKVGDLQTTAHMLKRIEGNVILAGWDQNMVWYAQCKSWAERMTTGRPYG